MKKILFISASIATLAMAYPARAQYVPSQPDPGYIFAPVTPQYGPPAPSGATPGYKWREQRANEDWRNNTWREQRASEDWRNNNWRTQRANEDWQKREDYTKERTPNNAVDSGNVECGVGSVGSSAPCRASAKGKTKNEYAKDRTENDYLKENRMRSN